MITEILNLGCPPRPYPRRYKVVSRPRLSRFLSFLGTAMKSFLEDALCLTSSFSVLTENVSLVMSSQDERLSSDADRSRQGFNELYIFLRDAFQERGLVRLLESTMRRTFEADQLNVAFLQRSFNSSSNTRYRVLNVLISLLSQNCFKALARTTDSASRPIPSSTLCRFFSICARISSKREYSTCLWYRRSKIKRCGSLTILLGLGETAEG